MNKKDILTFRREMKKSRYKIWLRTFLLVQFSTIFGYYFYHDIANGFFSWRLVMIYTLIFIPVGFLFSYLVPMKADMEMQAVTLSLDKIYLFLIWLLVIFKMLATYHYHTYGVADLIMAAIIGIMGGRLGGIGLRVRKLKLEHNFIKN